MTSDQQTIQFLIQKFWATFECLRCGKCCTIYRGGIYLQDGDIERLCIKLQISKRKFKDLYTIVGPDKVRRIKYPCPFHDSEVGCTVYHYRTRTCHDYPIRGVDAKTKQLLIDSNCPGVRKMLTSKIVKGANNETDIGGKLPTILGIS